MNKSELRAFYKTVRSEITDRCKKEMEIITALSHSVFFKECDNLFLYSASGSEASVEAVVDFAFESGKSVAFPVCSDRNGNMEFYRVKSVEELKKGMYGILEPDTDVCPIVYPNRNTLVVVPALAFDLEGYRLGYGKGYYDRYLAKYECASVGISFDECICKLLPRGNFDKKVNCVITDKNVYLFDSSKEE